MSHLGRQEFLQRSSGGSPQWLPQKRWKIHDDDDDDDADDDDDDDDNDDDDDDDEDEFDDDFIHVTWLLAFLNIGLTGEPQPADIKQPAA